MTHALTIRPLLLQLWKDQWRRFPGLFFEQMELFDEVEVTPRTRWFHDVDFDFSAFDACGPAPERYQLAPEHGFGLLYPYTTPVGADERIYVDHVHVHEEDCDCVSPCLSEVDEWWFEYDLADAITLIEVIVVPEGFLFQFVHECEKCCEYQTF